MDKPKFDHDFANSIGIVNVSEINGYCKCMGALLQFLKNETASDPAKRFIDSVKILERIENTNEELIGIMTREQDELKTWLNAKL